MGQLTRLLVEPMKPSARTLTDARLDSLGAATCNIPVHSCRGKSSDREMHQFPVDCTSGIVLPCLLLSW